MKSVKSLGKILSIDFETANSKRDSTCALGVCLKELGGKILFEEEFLINPMCEFSHFNCAVHGIIPETVADCPEFPEIHPQVLQLIKEADFVLSHNASFDVDVLGKMCFRYGLFLPEFRFICTLKMARSMLEGLPSYKLYDLAQRFSLPKYKAHDLLEDARTCAFLFEYMSEQFEWSSLKKFAKKKIAQLGITKNIDAKTLSFEKRNRSGNDDKIQAINQSAHPLCGKTVVFTGVLSRITRKEAQNMVMSVGARAGSVITKKTDYLVTGYQDTSVLRGNSESSKVRKAKEYMEKGQKLKIISGKEFLDMFSSEADEAKLSSQKLMAY